MYKISEEVLNLLNQNYRQIVEIKANTSTGSFTLTESDIIQGSLSIDRYSVSNSKIEIGSAVAAELSFKLKNDDEKYSNVSFEGAELFIKIGIKKWDAHLWENAQIHWIPCGYYIVDSNPRALNTISLSALDRMIKFDKDADSSLFSFPMTVKDMVDRICTICGVSLASSVTKYINSGYEISSFPESQNTLTYRSLLKWCAALMGKCAFINSDGNLELKWYEQTGITISSAERYSSDMYENDVRISGVYYKDASETEYLSGDNSYCLDVSDNLLIQSNVQTVLDTLYVSLKDFAYRPYTATIKPAPYLYPMDMIRYVDKKGVTHNTIVTNITFTMNLNTSIAGKGETEETQKYSQSGGLTQQQMTIIENLKKQTDTTIAAKENAQLEMNRILSNSLGLNVITVEQDDGTKIYYYCDGDTLEGSSIIYTFRANGFAWTTNWNNGNPVWQYGFTKDGNAILNTLYTYKVSTEYIEAGAITAEKINTSYKTSVEKQITDATNSANASTDEKLKSYWTTVEVETAIKQTSDSILLSAKETAEAYVDNELKNYSTTSEIEVAIGKITSSVSETYQTKSAASESYKNLESKITQTANSITSSVSNTYQTKTDASSKYSELKSLISQTESAIELSVSNTYETKTDASTEYKALESKITQSASDITLSVSQTYQTQSDAATQYNTLSSSISANATVIASKVTSAEVESLIEQKADSIRLSASKISWKSDYSTMTEDGKLTCTGATINGNITLGGENNASGKLTILDSTSTASTQIDKDGIVNKNDTDYLRIKESLLQGGHSDNVRDGYLDLSYANADGTYDVHLIAETHDLVLKAKNTFKVAREIGAVSYAGDLIVSPDNPSYFFDNYELLPDETPALTNVRQVKGAVIADEHDIMNVSDALFLFTENRWYYVDNCSEWINFEEA